jgi:hypothetical protein
MAYMLMMVEPVGQRSERGVAEGHVVYDRMLGFAESLKTRGVLRAVESLAPLDEGARLQVRDGKTHVLDGPFAEAKEMVGGFFLIDVATRRKRSPSPPNARPPNGARSKSARSDPAGPRPLGARRRSCRRQRLTQPPARSTRSGGSSRPR